MAANWAANDSREVIFGVLPTLRSKASSDLGMFCWGTGVTDSELSLESSDSIIYFM